MNINDVPQEHRDAVARWLLERAAEYRPSWLLGGTEVLLMQDALKSAAIDIAEGGDIEDTTLARDAVVLRRLREGD